MYKTLRAKPTIFAQFNNEDLAKKLDEQDRQVHQHWDGNDDGSNLAL